MLKISGFLFLFAFVAFKGEAIHSKSMARNS